MTAEQRERALQWLYRTMLKSAVPASYGSLCLQTSNNDAVAVWYPDGTCCCLPALPCSCSCGGGTQPRRSVASARTHCCCLGVRARSPRAGIEISLPTLAANGAWQYLCRFSGWERRGRFLGYSEIIRAVKRRVLAGFETSHFYLMTYGLRPSADRASLKAVILPICQRVRAPFCSHAPACAPACACALLRARLLV
ncbi:hypothetical protein EON68_04575 [archaeon]|nr:MAG: hypothetical protein EON68_04575 [archaeon]